MTIGSFKHRIVRDLAWVIASPPLISELKDNVLWLDHESCLQEYKDCLNTLKKLDGDPSPLITHIEAIKSKRLGYRFEAFIHYWLQISPNYEVFAHNIQIIESKRTLGEVDFIIKDTRSEKVIHIEVAVKFYLGTPPFEDAFHWFGTNTNDQLGKKQRHLESHQTQLALKYPEHFDYNIDERYCLLKGRLFYPFQDQIGQDTPPNNVTDNHLTGRWIRQGDISGEPSLSGLLLYPLHKHEWLSALLPEDIANEKLAEINTRDDLDRAQCFITVDKDNHSEVGRLFILPGSFEFPAN